MKKRVKSILTRSHHITVFSIAIMVLVGACQTKVCDLQSGIPSSNNQYKLAAKQTAEKKWAERFELSGVPNLYKVSEELYRGAQPSAEGMRQLEELGIKTVINLRFILSDRSKIKGTELDYEHINMTTLDPHNEQVVRFLHIVTDSDKIPVFVHCHRGIDRTGVLCAIYRIIVKGWNKDEAIEEMTKGSFALRSVSKNLVDYVRCLDIGYIKRKIGPSK